MRGVRKCGGRCEKVSWGVGRGEVSEERCGVGRSVGKDEGNVGK